MTDYFWDEKLIYLMFAVKNSVASDRSSLLRGFVGSQKELLLRRGNDCSFWRLLWEMLSPIKDFSAGDGDRVNVELR
ncbi:MAG: hypothetical protein SW833_02065 [Cyanobacteriota bacterium]|nr:hypothetical protein [Cyanobacteriota bacterium]